jgi:predicted MFS family arabinose efflux permease
MTTERNHGDPVSVRALLICAIWILILSMGVRHAFGLFLLPMTATYGWGREEFAFAIGLQNLMWGVAQPFAGAIGDRFGTHRVLAAGAVLYTLGLLGMAWSETPLTLALTGGVLIGVAHACTTYSVVFGALGRRVSPQKRSSAMGLISAAGSFGQFALMPLSLELISTFGWFETLLVFSALVALIMPLSRGLLETPDHSQGAGAHSQTIGSALREALSDRSYLLLSLAYFVCGFQVVFIGVHLPAYLKDANMPLHVAPIALGLIGLFNIFGSYASGVLGGKLPQRYVLASIYLLRSLAIIAFLLAPISPWSVYLFSAVMGVLWLSTVPPTNGIIATLFGMKNFSMLSGVSFFSHQVGSFLGVWLGGYVYDKVGNYDVVWALIILSGFLAALMHLPIKERPLARAALAAA